jgi:hypothetical protein
MRTTISAIGRPKSSKRDWKPENGGRSSGSSSGNETDFPKAWPLSSDEQRRFWELTAEVLDLFADEWNNGIGASRHNPSFESMIFHHTAAAIREALDGSLPAAWRGSGKGKARGGVRSAKERVAAREVAAFHILVDEGILPQGDYTKKLADYLVKIENYTELVQRKPNVIY